MRSIKHISVMLCLLFVASIAVPTQQSDRDRGIELYRAGKFTEAIELLEKSVAANANDRAAWIFLGGAYVHTGDSSKALKAFAYKTDRKSGVRQPTYDKSVNVTHKPRAVYTPAARRKGNSGTVRIAVEFQADGKLGFVFPLQTMLDPDLVQQAVDAAKGIQFEPATKDGKPVTVINLVEYGFFIA